MNHYLKNIAAKNLNLMEVIQPRLASRFEPAPQHILPAQKSLQSSVSRNGEYIAEDEYAQDNDASNHYALNNHAKVTAKNLVRSRPALVAGDPDSHGPETLVETESTGAARPQSPQKRSMPPISEKRMPFSSSGQAEGDMQANFETSRQPSLPSEGEGMTSDRSSILRFSGLASSRKTAPAREMVQKAIEKIGLEYQISPEEPSPFAPIEEKTIPLSIPEGKHVSPEQKTDLILKVVDRSASKIGQRKEEVMPHVSIEKNEQKSGTEHGIRQKTGELIAGTKPSKPLVSPGMVAAQPYVKSYFRSEGNGILDMVAKPETSASVQVTIGRIEIRATPATATPQRKRADHPVMSLEDYLKIKRGSL